jgi:hypothetical protein
VTLALAVESAAKAAAALGSRAAAKTARSVKVEPAEANGVILEFAEA